MCKKFGKSNVACAVIRTGPIFQSFQNHQDYLCNLSFGESIHSRKWWLVSSPKIVPTTFRRLQSIHSITFGFFILVEDLVDGFVEESMWTTVYYMFKIVFLIYLMHPKTKGANLVYKKVLEPFFLKNEKRLEAAEKSLADAASEVKDDAQKTTEEAAIAAVIQKKTQ